MSLSSLQVLADNRDALLLAEAIGWLHDYRKCSDEQLAGSGLARNTLENKFPNLSSLQISLGSLNESFLALLKWDDSGTRQQFNALGNYLVRCHRTSHFDKQEPLDGTQSYPNIKLSTPFGFEKNVPSNLTDSLWSLPWNKLNSLSEQKWQELRRETRDLFSQVIADRRRPINEVDLWSWGSLVGALYKASLAGTLLTGTVPAADDLQWRLLGVRLDGWGYISNVAHIPDLLARQRLLKDALDQVCTLLEVEYPLGSEIYRDQNGSVFIVPDVHDLLQRTDTSDNTLQAKIVEAFSKKMDGDLIPEVTLEQDPWYGQDPKWSRSSPTPSNDKLPHVGDMLTAPIVSQVDAPTIEFLWKGKDGNWEICPVCRLRPMKEGREACEHCLKRRSSRIAEWLDNPHRTIWIDEIADHNDRVALIVGKFGLDDWLSGDLVQTMLVKADPATNTFTPKNPSPARLRRVWETCQRFWTETAQGILDALPGRERWLLQVQEADKLPPKGVVCDGILNGQSISVWRMDDTLLTISFVPEKLKEGQLCLSWEYEGHKGQAVYQVKGVKKPSADYLCYHSTLTLLASPDQFLALVPAADAPDIAEKIRQEYTRQFGKVQNRLPLFLGLIFFQRKMPLFAVMDTARRMLETPMKEESWNVECCRPDAEEHKQQYLRLSQGEYRLIMKFPIKMGDNTTPDIWYPYVFVEHFADSTPNNREYRFQHNGRWLVHVSNLKENDVVKVTPSRFAYLFLESTAQRFRFDPQKDVMLLEELSRLKQIWEALKQSGITDTTLRNVQALLEAKAAAWGATSDEFRHLVETTLKEAGLYARKYKDGNPLSDVVTPQDVIGGRFAHCLELHMRVLKLRLKEAQNERQPKVTIA